MSGWKSTDAQANNEPKYISTLGRERDYANNYSNNTVLVTTSRLANSNTSQGVVNKQTAHTGWVHYDVGTGPLKSVAVSNVTSGLIFTSEYLTITGANTGSIVPIVSANVKMDVTGGNNITITVNSGGSGYTSAPTVSASSGNNATLVFTATTGGRAGRVQSEVLVALSTPSSADANASAPFFTGV